jgi:uncharacterized protein DUF6869
VVDDAPEKPGRSLAEVDALLIEAVAGEDPSRTLADIVDEIHADPDRVAIEMLGVGPLEALVHTHGETLWPEIERLARSDRLFREALREVWAYESAEYALREALLEESASEDGVTDP